MTDDLYRLPDDLPVPVDDGASDHLLGTSLPPITLESSRGPIDLALFAQERAVFYIYPRTGTPGRPSPAAWNAIPGARGCTPESCAFRDHAEEIASFGSRLAGISAQTLSEQIEFATRNGIRYPVIADPVRELGRALNLPTFEFEGVSLYKRMTLIVEREIIVRVFYPVFPPDKAVDEVVEWLSLR